MQYVLFPPKTTGDYHVKVKAGIRGMQQQTGKCQRFIATIGNYEEARKDSPVHFSEGHLDLGFLASRNVSQRTSVVSQPVSGASL